jgi:alanine transaminase
VYLNEARGWSLERPELERALAEARARGLNVRALVVINPGNPTGNSLSEENVRDVLAFASRERLVLMADEVYQENVWAASRPFVSFKRIAVEMGLLDAQPHAAARNAANGARGLQLASFHSTSKGFTGECGRRGGYVELCGFDEDVRAELYKLASISLCGNTAGQLVVGLQARPPRPGDASYELYRSERDAILASLRRRAERLVGALRGLEGVTCEEPEGALYAFPQVSLPARAVAAARAAGKQPDTFYCLALLDATGIVVVPGSGFGQREGTWHFRSTILPPERNFDAVVSALANFHRAFMDKYRG